MNMIQFGYNKHKYRSLSEFFGRGSNFPLQHIRIGFGHPTSQKARAVILAELIYFSMVLLMFMILNSELVLDLQGLLV